MPWPTFLKDGSDTEQLVSPYFLDGRMGVPSYVLVDQAGKEVARGKAAAMKMIKDAE